jgi:hypothetical protein
VCEEWVTKEQNAYCACKNKNEQINSLIIFNFQKEDTSSRHRVMTDDGKVAVDVEQLFAIGFGEPDAPEDGDDDTQESFVVRLQNGNFHVCGQNCPFVKPSLNREKEFVCSVSGQVLAASVEASHSSSWTGRSTGSADPDMTSGACSAKVFKAKRDAFGDSARAYSKARQMAVEDAYNEANNSMQVDGSGFESSIDFPGTAALLTKSTKERKNPKVVKRGALCVDEIDESESKNVRQAKAIRRINNLENREVQQRLCADASGVVRKLFSHHQKVATAASNLASSSSASSSSTTTTTGGTARSSGTANTGAQQPIDPRFENFEFVFKFGLKRYVARCIEANEPVQLNEMHDVGIAAASFVRTKRAEARKREHALRAKLLCQSSRTTELCGRLVVSIWNAVCCTTYFVKSQPGDSFRPFAAGVIYSFKRGLRLKKENRVIVPNIDTLADLLPTLKTSSGHPEARQLQASAHRGLCSLHRAIASSEMMPEEEKARFFEKLTVSSSIARSLVDHVRKVMNGETR